MAHLVGLAQIISSGGYEDDGIDSINELKH